MQHTQRQLRKKEEINNTKNAEEKIEQMDQKRNKTLNIFEAKEEGVIKYHTKAIDRLNEQMNSMSCNISKISSKTINYLIEQCNRMREECVLKEEYWVRAESEQRP